MQVLVHMNFNCDQHDKSKEGAKSLCNFSNKNFEEIAACPFMNQDLMISGTLDQLN